MCPGFHPVTQGTYLASPIQPHGNQTLLNRRFFSLSKDVDIPYAYFPTPIFHCLKWSVCPCGFVHDIFVALCVQLQNKVRVIGGSIYEEYIALCPTHMTECCLLKKSYWPFFTMVYIENSAGRSPHLPRRALRQTNAFMEKE